MGVFLWVRCPCNRLWRSATPAAPRFQLGESLEFHSSSAVGSKLSHLSPTEVRRAKKTNGVERPKPPLVIRGGAATFTIIGVI